MDEVKRKQVEIYEHYGLSHQLEKLEEECMELALAIQRFKYNPRIQQGSINVVEEMADVLNLIEQISHGNPYLRKDIHTWKELKIDREIERIKNNSK